MQIKDLLTEKRLRHLEEMVSEITVDELKSKIKRNEIFKLVEISNPDDFDNGHIDGAINIPLDSLATEANKRFRKFQQIVIYVQEAASSVGTVAAGRRRRGNRNYGRIESNMVKIKSVYAKASKEDGRRILVDLFWPEGLKTREAGVDEWLSELGPSYDLQRFHYDTSNWQTYKSMYEKEVLDAAEKKKLLENISKQSKDDTVTLLYGSKDAQYSHASILKELIEK